MLGLFTKDAKQFILDVDGKNNESIPQEIIDIAEERKIARQNKDWAKSDLLRNTLAEKGYEVKDSKDGYSLIKK